MCVCSVGNEVYVCSAAGLLLLLIVVFVESANLNEWLDDMQLRRREVGGEILPK
jgi:hypothetical protein